MGYFQVRYDSRVVIYNHEMFIRLAAGAQNLARGQSYKTFTLVNYNSRVIIWGYFK